MIQTEKKTPPAGVQFFALLLAVFGLLDLIGWLLPPRTLTVLAYLSLAIALLMVSTGILVYFNHKSALYFVAALTTVFTLAIVGEMSHLHFALSAPAIGPTLRLFSLPVLYWCAFLWYRKWRAGPDSH